MHSSHWLRAFEAHGGEIFVRGKALMERRKLTPDCQPIGTLLSAQRTEVRELVWYLLVMSLVDAHKAKIKSVQVVNRQHYLTIEPVSGSRFAVRRPPISMGAELRLREAIKRVL